MLDTITRIVRFTDTRKTKEGTVTELIDVEIDFDKWFSASKPEKDSEDKNLRKLLGLPLTKALIHYPNAYPCMRNQYTKENIKRYRICDVYEVSDFWATVEIETESGKILRIHSDFLAHMQKPMFVKDMEEMYAGE